MRKIVWLMLVAVIGTAGWFAWALLTPTEPSGQTFVLLRPGSSTHRIAAELKNAGIIRSEEVFVLWHYYHHGRSLKAGNISSISRQTLSTSKSACAAATSTSTP